MFVAGLHFLFQGPLLTRPRGHGLAPSADSCRPVLGFCGAQAGPVALAPKQPVVSAADCDKIHLHLLRQTMRTRHRYLPIIEAQAEMLLAAPASAVTGGSVRFSLPAGHRLTEENLHQFVAHSVEFIFVDEADTRTDEEVANETAQVAGRVLQIFEGADLSDPNLAAFFDQILAYRNA